MQDFENLAEPGLKFAEDKGIVRHPLASVDAPVVTEEDPKTPTQPVHVTYSSAPSHPRQLVEMPDTVRPKNVKVATFVLAPTADVKVQDAYEALQARTTPLESPQIMIETERTEFHKGAWHIFVKYRELSYQKI